MRPDEAAATGNGSVSDFEVGETWLQTESGENNMTEDIKRHRSRQHAREDNLHKKLKGYHKVWVNPIWMPIPSVVEV